MWIRIMKGQFVGALVFEEGVVVRTPPFLRRYMSMTMREVIDQARRERAVYKIYPGEEAEK